MKTAKSSHAKLIAVCGASSVDRTGAQRARAVGRLIAKSGYGLICGGLGGAMEAACRGAKEEGGLTVGVLPGIYRADANDYVDIPIVTNMGHARNLIIVQSALAVIALPGSAGTLSEIAIALKIGVPVIGLDSWENIGKVIYATDPTEAVGKAVKLAERTRK